MQELDQFFSEAPIDTRTLASSENIYGRGNVDRDLWRSWMENGEARRPGQAGMHSEEREKNASVCDSPVHDKASSNLELWEGSKPPRRGALEEQVDRQETKNFAGRCRLPYAFCAASTIHPIEGSRGLRTALEGDRMQELELFFGDAPIDTSFLVPSGDIYGRGKQGPSPPPKELGWETEKPGGQERQGGTAGRARKIRRSAIFRYEECLALTSNLIEGQRSRWTPLEGERHAEIGTIFRRRAEWCTKIRRLNHPSYIGGENDAPDEKETRHVER